MIVKRIARRRQHRSTFAVVGIVIFTAITIAVHSLLSTAPLWMAAAVAGFPALVITDAGMAVADRWGCLPKATAQAGSAHDDIDARILRWASALESLVGGGFLGWFGQSWHDHWRHIYPATPGWLLYLTIIALWGFTFAAVERSRLKDSSSYTAGAATPAATNKPESSEDEVLRDAHRRAGHRDTSVTFRSWLRQSRHNAAHLS